MYSVGTVLRLDDQKSYAVVSTQNVNEKKYVYLVDINDNSNIMFCEIQGEELVFVDDKILIQKLILMINQDINGD